VYIEENPDEFYKHFKKEIKKYNFTDKNLSSAIKRRVEVIFNCKSYCLINPFNIRVHDIIEKFI
jgi:hypothetical protein